MVNYHKSDPKNNLILKVLGKKERTFCFIAWPRSYMLGVVY